MEKDFDDLKKEMIKDLEPQIMKVIKFISKWAWIKLKIRKVIKWLKA